MLLLTWNKTVSFRRFSSSAQSLSEVLFCLCTKKSMSNKLYTYLGIYIYVTVVGCLRFIFRFFCIFGRGNPQHTSIYSQVVHKLGSLFCILSFVWQIAQSISGDLCPFTIVVILIWVFSLALFVLFRLFLSVCMCARFISQKFHYLFVECEIKNQRDFDQTKNTHKRGHNSQRSLNHT